ncbi:MAG: HD-GYP domain-containing protein [Huintestinicola sp.]|uniref:HD-GYP domain-containing protein n=1 Tax=Huintestinicola sp. TaxID=2981661 RepID=UPI003F120B8A
MNFSDKIINEYRENADKRLAFVCRLMIGFMLLVAVLNISGVFKIEPLPLYLTVAVSIVNFFLPTLLCNILKISSVGMRYFILGLMVFQSGLQYATLSYHTIIMLVFPLVMSCLYNERKYVIYTSVLSIPMIVISHFAAYYLKVVPDEPLITLKGTILYGIIQRTIEFCAVVIICLFISDRIEKLVDTLANKNKELYEDQENLILSLSQIIENKSENTGQHVKRVSEYTEVLCRSLGYSAEESWKISLAAMMHDVGKIMIPENILEKPGKLTAEEFDIVKDHIKYGKQMLETSPGELFKMSTEIAYQHHEKWDGTGYMGIRGDNIAPYARCVALADVFDALVSRRAYKKPWAPEEAYDEIVSQSGKQFDPEVVDAFVQNFDKFIEIMKRYPDE